MKAMLTVTVQRRAVKPAQTFTGISSPKAGGWNMAYLAACGSAFYYSVGRGEQDVREQASKLHADVGRIVETWPGGKTLVRQEDGSWTEE